ncbi:hypothetical protein MEG_01480 [Bartonella tamiae Th307]|uniref:Uncharacterized protein n=1 Tax=Bartonella tamiae Th239 TaxID=1094558 RepID=J0R5U5_9HYPH|nr:hypothetical protein ME5_00401 [Bartonella tamiae Th239]EJF93266.1 hypothetical protein MEG_01480 [Bartonella tamiae Th307]
MCDVSARKELKLDDTSPALMTIIVKQMLSLKSLFPNVSFLRNV